MNWSLCWLLGHKPGKPVLKPMVDGEQFYVYACERKGCKKLKVSDVKI